MRAVFEDSNFELCILETGYRKPLTRLTLSDKPALMTTLKLHLLFRVKPELDQFRDGLKACGVLGLVQRYQQLMAPFFVHTEKDLTQGVYYM